MEDTYTEFVRAGALLSDTDKAALKEVNLKLSDLYLAFNRNLLSATNAFRIVVNDPKRLWTPRELCRSSRRRSPRGRPPRRQLGVYPSGPSRLPLLQYADDRELRREMYEGYVNLASSGEYNNGPVINDIVHARARKAALLSYPDYASYMTANVMAKNPAAAEDLLMQIWRPAVKRVGEEVAEMQALADKEGAGITIAPTTITTTPKGAPRQICPRRG